VQVAEGGVHGARRQAAFAHMMISAVIAPVRVGLMMPSVAVSTTRVQHRLCARSLGADVRRAQPAVESHKREAEVGDVMSASAKAAGLWYLAIAVVGSIAHTLGALVIYGVSCFACFAYAWGTRPVGLWAQRPAEGDESSSLKVKTSAIPGAGLGLFAARDLQEGLVLGTYPGRIWDTRIWLFCKGWCAADLLRPMLRFARGSEHKHERAARKQLRQRRAMEYVWILSPSLLIDPTDSRGLLRSHVPHISSTLLLAPPVETLLCRINEPPRGLSTRPNVCNNVEARLGTGGGGRSVVELALVRQVSAGTELLLDYGSSYDRSRYCAERR